MRNKIMLMLSVLVLINVNGVFAYIAPSYNNIPQRLCASYTAPVYSNVASRLSPCTWDTCTYSGSGDWTINCADMCKVTTPTIVSGKMLFYGIGLFEATANIIHRGYELIKATNCGVIFR